MRDREKTATCLNPAKRPTSPRPHRLPNQDKAQLVTSLGASLGLLYFGVVIASGVIHFRTGRLAGSPDALVWHPGGGSPSEYRCVGDDVLES